MDGGSMDSWLPAALISLLLYGFWGFFPKLAVHYLSPESALIYEIGGIMVVGFLALAMLQFRPEFHPSGALYAAATGVAGIIGTLFFFIAARKGKISVVVSLTALYPLVTIALTAILLREPISLRQCAGMLLALLAIFLLSG